MYSSRQLWIALRSSLWLVPSLLVLSSALMAVALMWLDGIVHPRWFEQLPWLFGAQAEGSRGMLTAIATSMITVAGVTFSITVVALAQASSQYSPLVLRNFMRDRGNQIVLGIFGGIFVYSLLVLRSIRSEAAGDIFVPGLAVMGALLYAVVSIGFLIYFIHHIATVLQASSILSVVASNTRHAFTTLFPEELAKGAGEDEVEALAVAVSTRGEAGTWYPVLSKRTGYIQSVRAERMAELASKHDMILRLERGIGDFAAEGATIASVCIGASPNSALLDSIRDLFLIGEYRTIDQDAAFGFRQIVDIALKALSPGVNDPTTACSCLDYLGSLLVALAQRRIETRFRSRDGKLRVIAHGPTFEILASLSFDQIRQAMGNDTVLAETLIDTIATVACSAHQNSRKAVMIEHLDLVLARASEVLEQDRDRERIARSGARAKRMIMA